MDGFDEATKSPFEKWKEGIKSKFDFLQKIMIVTDYFSSPEVIYCIKMCRRRVNTNTCILSGK